MKLSNQWLQRQTKLGEQRFTSRQTRLREFKSPSQFLRKIMNIKYIIIHHSALNSLEFDPQFDVINNGHKERNWGTVSKPIYAKKSKRGYYVQYHYFIESNGKVKRGRGENEVGWHCGHWKTNKSSIAICLAGNFDEELPTKEQKESLTNILKDLKLAYPNAEIKYHRDIKPTHCPGLRISKDWAKNLILNDNNMRYVKSETKEQYLLDDRLMIGLNIGDESELIILIARGLTEAPAPITDEELCEYEIYPLVRKSRFRDLLGF